MRVERTRQADDDLVEVYLYGYERFGHAQAERYYAQLVDTFERLAGAPLMCPERTEFTPPVRIHHHGRHLIVYTLARDHILIVRVLHDHVALERHL